MNNPNREVDILIITDSVPVFQTLNITLKFTFIYYIKLYYIKVITLKSVQ